jgi:predicted RNase H-like nuclease
LTTVTLGIDLAAQAKNTAACSIRWGEGRPAVLLLARGKDREGAPLDDKWISTRAAGLRDDDLGCRVTKVGIDDPFGWPVPFLDAMEAYRSGPGWPYPIESGTEQLRLRETDRVVSARTGRRPLSVSSDRIAIPAMRCAGLLTAIAGHLGPAAVSRDGSGRCCEVYPDPALRGWIAATPAALGRASYKRQENSTTRVRLLEALLRQLPLDDPDGQLDQVAAEDDYLDALLCALIARAVELGQTHLPEPGREAELALVEGWIHVPDRPLADLVAA